MSFFEDASLVLIPSGYKASKVYSVKPTDGTGDLTFTRSLDTATRVGPDGLIEKVRTNLALHSEDFTNAYYTKIFATVTANTIANPVNGAITADTITPTADNDVHRVRLSPTGLSAIVHTFSIIVKANGYNFVRVIENTTTGDFKTFDLLNGTIVDGALGGQIVALGNGFFRCSAQMVVAASQVIDVQIQETSGTQSFIGNGTSGIFAFGAQLETGDIATPYIGPTTTAAVSVGMLANVPRLDYYDTTCPNLLLEPQRQNLVTFSEQLNNAAWTKTGTTIIANVATSPAGFTDADKIVGDASAGDKLAFQARSITTVQAFTISAFFKKSEYKLAFIRAGGQTGSPYVIYNLDTEAVVQTSGASSTKIEDYGNEWYRVSFTLNSATGGTCAPNISFLPDSGFTLSAINVPQYTGDGTSGGFVWGCQLEANGGSFATSYIPTLGAAVTRSADAASKTGISSLIGQTEGTLFVEMQRLNTGTGSGVVPFQLNDGTNNNRAQIEITTGGSVLCIVSSGGSVVANITGPTLTIGQTAKIAISYKLNDFKLFVNGVLGGVDTLGAVPVSMSRLDLASEVGVPYAGYTLSQALHFKTALTSTQLAELTA